MGMESLIQKGELESLIFSARRNFIDNFNNNEDNTTMKIYYYEPDSAPMKYIISLNFQNHPLSLMEIPEPST